MVLKTIDNSIDTVFGVFHELIVVLLCLDRVHVTCGVQQIAQNGLDLFLFCLVDAKFVENFLLLFELLVDALNSPGAIRTDCALLVEGVGEDLEVHHRGLH